MARKQETQRTNYARLSIAQDFLADALHNLLMDRPNHARTCFGLAFDSLQELGQAVGRRAQYKGATVDRWQDEEREHLQGLLDDLFADVARKSYDEAD